MHRNPRLLPEMIDHLVYAVPELASGVRAVESLLGVSLSPGGRHPDLGSHNALLRIGPRTYLEVVAPDPDQPRPADGHWFATPDTVLPALVAWCARTDDLQALAAGPGSHLVGPVRRMSRINPDGDAPSWTLTMPLRPPPHCGVVPFFIDWGATRHPCATLPDAGVRLKSLVARSSQPRAVQDDLRLLSVALDVEHSAEPGLAATLEIAGGAEVALA